MEDRIEIVPFEKVEFKDGEVYVDDVVVNYFQNCDCTENSDDVQKITISSRNNGMARFINIKTDNWSIGYENDLKVLIEDFVKRAGIVYETPKKKDK